MAVKPSWELLILWSVSITNRRVKGKSIFFFFFSPGNSYIKYPKMRGEVSQFSWEIRVLQNPQRVHNTPRAYIACLRQCTLWIHDVLMVHWRFAYSTFWFWSGVSSKHTYTNLTEETGFVDAKWCFYHQANSLSYKGEFRSIIVANILHLRLKGNLRNSISVTVVSKWTSSLLHWVSRAMKY